MTGEIWKSPCGKMELRCGEWQTVLVDVIDVDAVITDPPYGERVHAGHNHAVRQSRRLVGPLRSGLSYASMSPDDVAAFVDHWSSRASGWLVAMTSHDLFPRWVEAFRRNDRCDFQPLPLVIPGMTVRMAGDGPSSWCVWLAVARPRNKEFARWGTLPGAYRATSDHECCTGGKPLAGMRALVRDYSRPGDLICDPCAGGGTTLLAAAIEGRRAIGAEMDPKTFALAVRRLSAGYTPGLNFATG